MPNNCPGTPSRKNCFACHTAAHSGGLQLDSRDSLIKGGNSGPAIVPGNPEHSLLILRLTDVAGNVVHDIVA
jgi:hypothetical protein